MAGKSRTIANKKQKREAADTSPLGILYVPSSALLKFALLYVKDNSFGLCLLIVYFII